MRRALICPSKNALQLEEVCGNGLTRIQGIPEDRLVPSQHRAELWRCAEELSWAARGWADGGLDELVGR
jgi:hypothetical protein